MDVNFYISTSLNIETRWTSRRTSSRRWSRWWSQKMVIETALQRI